MRYRLYLFRCGLLLSQQQMADRIGCHRATYSAIETGKQNGRVTFWNKLQRAFDLTDAQKGELMSIDKKKSNRATC
jgi:DNA-binding XRE family transcriptional regulator